MSKPEDLYKERDELMRAELRPSGLAFIRPLLTHPDIKEATKLVKEHAGQEFDRAYAAEMEAVTLDCGEWDERADASRDELHDLEQQKKATNTHIKVSMLRGGGQQEKISFRQWDLKDQLVFPLTLVLMVLVLCAGAANVYSAIMAEAQPAFLEQPFLAIFLACLLPAGSVAIHSLGDLLPSDRSRERFMRAILFLTALFLFSWAILFGFNFQIGDDAIDFESLGEDTDHIATAFTIVQLLAEMLCGTSLFLITGHIHSRYHGETTIHNPAFMTLREHISDLRPIRELDHKRRKEARGRLMQLRAMREAHITEQVALYVSMRRRFDESSPL